MAQFIELEVIIDLSDPYEKTAPTLFNKAFITDPTWDKQGKIWFNYQGKEINAKGDWEKFREALLT